MRRFLAGLALALALLLSACSGASPFEEAHAEIDDLWATVLDDGTGLLLDGAGESSAGMPVEVTARYLHALEVPQSVLMQMSKTRALDGTQSASWDGITAMWTYHPDNGLDIILTLD